MGGWIIIGIFIGWATKVPFLIKWYRELRKTNEYKEWKKQYEAYRAMQRHDDCTEPIKI